METKNTEATSTVALTDAALKEVKRLLDLQGITEGGLRLGVKGGGCSGFQYGFTFDDPAEGDQVIKVEDITVVVDPQSAIYLRDSRVDYVEDFRGAGFSVENPNAAGGCGCGQSFSV